MKRDGEDLKDAPNSEIRRVPAATVAVGEELPWGAAAERAGERGRDSERQRATARNSEGGRGERGEEEGGSVLALVSVSVVGLGLGRRRRLAQRPLG